MVLDLLITSLPRTRAPVVCLLSLFVMLLGRGCSVSGKGFSHHFYHFNIEKDGWRLAFSSFEESISSMGT